MLTTTLAQILNDNELSLLKQHLLDTCDGCVTAFFDARQMPCPMPLLKAKINLRDIGEGQNLYLLADDKNSQTDLVAFCHKNGHRVLVWTSQDDGNVATIFHFIITKNGEKN